MTIREVHKRDCNGVLHWVLNVTITAVTPRMQQNILLRLRALSTNVSSCSQYSDATRDGVTSVQTFYAISVSVVEIAEYLVLLAYVGVLLTR